MAASPTLLQLTNGQIAVKTATGITSVQITPCFPWSAPTEFLSLRDSDGNEVLFLEKLSELDEISRTILEKELAQSTGTFHVVSIQSLSKEIELRCWEVTTREGRRSFQTELDEWPREMPNGSFLVEDLFGDLYVVPPLDNLDPESQKFFWPLIG